VPRIDQPLRHHLLHRIASRLRPLFRVEIMRRIDPPFPIQPKLSRVLRVEVILDLESEPAGEILRPFADQEMMVRLFHHRLGHKRRRPHALEGGYAPRPPFRSVHATRI
jgi:hypothetical protein